MNILYVSHLNSYPPIKGELVHIANVIKELNNLGHTVYALSHERHPKAFNLEHPFDRKELEKIQIVYVRQTMRNEVDWTVKLKKINPNLKIFWEINAPIYELNYVTELYFKELGSNWIKKEIKKIQLKIEMVKIWNIWRKKRRLSQHIDGVITVSQVMEDYLKKEFNAPVCHVPNGTDPKWRFRPLDKVLHILIAGSDLKWIDWETPVNLIKEFASDENFHFHVIGKELEFENVSNYERMTQESLSDLITKCHVSLVLYNNYDWCPIGFYNSSLKLFEYMGSGKVVIATKTGQIKDIIENDKDGFLVPHYAVAEIAQKIRELKDDPQKMHSISLSAFNKISNHYTWNHTITKIMKFIKSLQ